MGNINIPNWTENDLDLLLFAFKNPYCPSESLEDLNLRIDSVICAKVIARAGQDWRNPGTVYCVFVYCSELYFV